MVAAGGGGYGAHGTGGNGGGGGYYGGGVAWYSGAGGGSSYIAGFDACPEHYSGVKFMNCSWSANAGPSGSGFARILLKTLD